MARVANNAETTSKMPGGITGKGWKPGQSGNPSGRPKKLPITEQLQEIFSDPAKARAYVLAAIKHAMRDGSSAHFKEINERLEGKVADKVEHTGADGEPIEHTIRFGVSKSEHDDER